VARHDYVLRSVGVTQTVTLWEGLKRIDIGITLHSTNGELWREFRAAFPFALDKAQVTYGVPMGVVRIGKDEVPTTGGHAYGKLTYFENCADIRPREVLDFVDVSDGRGGMTLTLGGGVSVFDWRDITGLCASNAAVVQPVLLATRKSCNGEGVWYPQTGTHDFRFSLTGHGGDWRQGWRAGIEANHPLEAVSAAPAKGWGAALPPESAFVKVDAPNVRVTAVKEAEDGDGVVVRLVEMEGRDCEVALVFGRPVKSARRANIIEDPEGVLKPRGDTVVLPVGHHAIETVRVTF
jgi:alpha-mannosidase